MNALNHLHLKDKHLHITSDSELLKKIYATVDNNLFQHEKYFTLIIISKLLLYSVLVIASYASLFVVKNPIFFIIAFILFGIFLLLLAFNFAHDFSHNTIFKSKSLNNFCFTAIYTLAGAHAEAWKQRHIHSHHYAPNVEGYDSDLSISQLIRVTPGSKTSWYHRYQHLYAPVAYTTYSLFWVFVKDVVLLHSVNDIVKEKGFRYHLSFWVQKLFYVGYILFLPLLFTNQEWYIVLIGFILMHMVQSLFLLFTFFMTHHVESTSYPTTDKEGYINSSWLMNQVKSSNDMHPFSKTANFILGGFNNHIAHHLFPHIHHIHYPELSRLIYHELEEHGIEPNQTTYFGGIASHLRHLKRMGRAD